MYCLLPMTFDDLRNLASGLFAFIYLVVLAIILPIGGLYALNYQINAGKIVNTINAQCGTNYRKMDYLIVGTQVMLQLCETRQKRLEIAK